MAKSRITKRRFKTIPGTIIECKSGTYIAFYETRTDIIAHGDSEIEAKANLKSLYATVIKHEKEEQEGKPEAGLPKTFVTKKFTEKILAH